jgi:hypothetical protein
LWIAEKHRAATHDRIATQRILSVPTNRRVIEAVEGACSKARPATSCSQRTFTAVERGGFLAQGTSPHRRF